MINKQHTYAIVGASNHKEKYGHLVTKDLKEAGYKVIPINLKEEEILGLKVYHYLKDYPGKIDVVITVIPPDVTEKVLEEVKELGIKNVWIQPGSESQKAIDFCKENDIEVVSGACIMIERVKERND